MNIELTRYDEVFLEYSIKWFRDKELLKLLDAGEVTPEGQRKWFESLPGRSDYVIWGVLYNGIPIGAAGLKHINRKLNIAELFCYIGDKGMRGRGYGSTILSLICKEAREMRLGKLYLHVLNSNSRAIKLYTKCGFVVDSKDNVLTLMSMNL